MNIGIIADIHANVPNLRRALALLRDLGADTIVCAGDLVGDWSDNGAARLIQTERIPCVQGNNDRPVLRDLPLSLRFEWEQRRVLLTHASPWDQTTYIRPNGLIDHFYLTAAEADADIVILGHTHIPMAVEVGGVWVFNPGSVDVNRAGARGATFALLQLPQLRYRVYDIATGKPAIYTFARIESPRHTSDAHQHRDHN